MNRPRHQSESTAEQSNVKTLSPVPVKTMRLSGLSDPDCTQFFATGALVERGKAVSLREQARLEYERGMAARAADEAAARAAAVAPGPSVAPVPSKPGPWQQFRGASWPRKASALLLPLLIALLVLKPVFKKPVPLTAPASAPVAASSAPLAAELAVPSAPKLAPTPAQPPPTLARGVTLEKAAVDAIAAGDFTRALTLYRELSRREPGRQVYQDALSILERRVRTP